MVGRLAQRLASLRTPTLAHIANHLGVAVASKFVPVASIFVYSRFMTIEDYGVLNLFTSYLWIFVIIMSLNLHTSVGRYIYTPDADFGRFLGTTLLAIGAIYLFTVTVILAGLGPVAQFLGLPAPVIALMFLVVLGQIAESLFTQITIFHQRSASLLRVMLLKAMVTFALGMVLLATMQSERYLAVLYADAAVSLAMLAFVLIRLWPQVHWSFRWHHARAMFSYALPLIPYMLSLTLLSQFDRVMIDRFHGKEATGLYSLAYNIGILLLMVVTAVLNTFNPAFFDALNKKDYPRVVRDAEGVFDLALLVTAVLVLFGQDLAALLAPAKYAGAFDLVPTVAIGGLCFVIFQIWVRVMAFAHRTALISVIAIMGTAVNIALNYWLLPLYGFKVAAATTVVAYLVMSLVCVWTLNHVILLFKVDVRRELLCLALLTVLAGVLQVFSWPVTLLWAVKVTSMALLAWYLKGPLIRLVRSSSAGRLA